MASIEIDVDKAAELDERHRQWSWQERGGQLGISGYIRGDHTPGRMTYHQLDARFLEFLRLCNFPFREL